MLERLSTEDIRDVLDMMSSQAWEFLVSIAAKDQLELLRAVDGDPLQKYALAQRRQGIAHITGDILNDGDRGIIEGRLRTELKTREEQRHGKEGTGRES